MGCFGRSGTPAIIALLALLGCQDAAPESVLPPLPDAALLGARAVLFAFDSGETTFDEMSDPPIVVVGVEIDGAGRLAPSVPLALGRDSARVTAVLIDRPLASVADSAGGTLREVTAPDAVPLLDVARLAHPSTLRAERELDSGSFGAWRIEPIESTPALERFEVHGPATRSTRCLEPTLHPIQLSEISEMTSLLRARDGAALALGRAVTATGAQRAGAELVRAGTVEPLQIDAPTVILEAERLSERRYWALREMHPRTLLELDLDVDSRRVTTLRVATSTLGPSPFTDLAGSSLGGDRVELYVTTRGGEIERFDGARFTRVTLPPDRRQAPLQIAALGPGRAIAYSARQPNLLIQDAAAIEEELPGDCIDSRTIEVVDGLGIVLACEISPVQHKLWVRRSLDERWQLLTDATLNIRVLDIAAFDDGFAYAAGEGAWGQWSQRASGLCPRRPIVGRKSWTHVVPIGPDDVLLGGGSRGDGNSDIVAWLQRPAPL